MDIIREVRVHFHEASKAEMNLNGLEHGLNRAERAPGCIPKDTQQRKIMNSAKVEPKLLELGDRKKDKKQYSIKHRHGDSLRSTEHEKSFQSKETNLLRRQRKQISRDERSNLSKRNDQEIIDALNSALGVTLTRRDEQNRLRLEDQQRQRETEMTDVYPRSNFDVEIVVHKYVDALSSAIYEEKNDQEALSCHHLALWTDGSKVGFGSNSQMGAAVVYQRYRGERVWVENAWNIQGKLNIDDVELVAIGEALEIALSEIHNSIHRDRTRERATKIRYIVVFTDSQVALKSIAFFRRDFHRELVDPAIRKIIKRTEGLKDMGVHVRLQWVPGHSGIRGNELADSLAKRAARYYTLTRIKVPHLVNTSFRVRHVHKAENRQLSGRWGDRMRASQHGGRRRGFGRQREFQLVDVDGDEKVNRKG
jgi:ribonuclease HI